MSNQTGDKPEDQQANGGSEDEEIIFPEDEVMEDVGEDAPLEAEPELTDLEKAHVERDRMRERFRDLSPEQRQRIRDRMQRDRRG